MAQAAAPDVEEALAAPQPGPASTRVRRSLPALWSRAQLALLRPSARVGRGRLSLTLMITEIASPREGRALHEVARLLTEHDRVLLPAIRAYRGRRITSRGTSTLAAFASPTDAVLCGMAIQDLLALRNASAPPGEEVSVRLAIHLGEVRFRRGRLGGAPVELARTICSVAAAGQVWLTRSVHLAMNHVEAEVEALVPVATGADREPIPVYLVTGTSGEREQVEGEPAGVAEGGVLEPVADAIASIEEGAAEGRALAVLRVVGAAAALALLRLSQLALGLALSGAVLAASVTRRRGGDAPRLQGLSRGMEGGLRWIRSRRAIPRAALIRPLW